MNNIPKIICVAGPIASGKSTVAEILYRQVQDHFVLCAFADELKAIICRTFGVNIDFINQWKRRDEIPPGFTKTMRETMQFIGEEFRKLKPGCWADFLLNQQYLKCNLIISDGRYIDEIETIKKNNGKVILVWKPDCNLDCEHHSETEVSSTVKHFLGQNTTGPNFVEHVDFFIKNDKTKEDLESNIIFNLMPVLLR